MIKLSLFTLLFTLVIGQVCWANNSIAVIYPDIPSPDNRLFDDIIKGIETEHPQRLILKAISKAETPQETIMWVNQQHPDMLITLGKRGFRIAKRLYKKKSVVIGALPIKPNGVSGISLSADPTFLFQSLNNLAPNISKVHVVYSSASNWLIDLASDQAQQYGLRINKLEVKNIKQALASYEQLLNHIDSTTDAIWLPADKITTHDQVILPTLLASSWEHNLVLFSSTSTHSKRGALFSVVPDYHALGKQLVTMVKQIHSSDQKTSVIPLQHLKLAVNLRTASHLGYNYPAQQKTQFHLTYPQ